MVSNSPERIMANAGWKHSSEIREYEFTAPTEFSNAYPKLTSLLLRARAWSVKDLDGIDHILWAWTRPSGEVIAWLGLPPEPNPRDYLHPDHKLLLRGFGGLWDTDNTNSYWVSNLYGLLTARALSPVPEGYLATRSGFARGEHILLGTKANGDYFICDRSSGRVHLVMGTPSEAYGKLEKSSQLITPKIGETLRGFVEGIAGEMELQLRIGDD